KAFTVQGYGTVVTGIPLSGQARIGDEIELLPHGLMGRIKRIEVYGRASDTVLAGQCAAVNVGHWDRREIGRGDVIAVPGYFAPEEWYVCRLKVLPRERIALKSGGAVKFHTGTSETPATIYPLDQPAISAAGDYFAQFRMERPVVAGPGDHFIIRSLSPLLTVGGGVILEATPQRLKRGRPNLIEGMCERLAVVGDDCALVELCVRRAPDHAAAEPDIAQRCKVTRGRLRQILDALMGEGRLLPLPGGQYLHRQTSEELAARITEELSTFHQQSPQSPGAPPDDLRKRVELGPGVFQAAVDCAGAQGALIEQHGRLALPTHLPTIDDKDARAVSAVETLLLERLFSPPDVKELSSQTELPPAAVERALSILGEHGQLIPIEGLFFHRDAVTKARQILIENLQREGRLESVQFKYLLDTTRKYALPLLDYFDRVGLTRRVGNTRTLRPSTGDPPRGATRDDG
ncbi:MAG: SelB C-terminal domain-containing protein, partial [Planctomycetota bacterium]